MGFSLLLDCNIKGGRGDSHAQYHRGKTPRAEAEPEAGEFEGHSQPKTGRGSIDAG